MPCDVWSNQINPERHQKVISSQEVVAIINEILGFKFQHRMFGKKLQKSSFLASLRAIVSSSRYRMPKYNRQADLVGHVLPIKGVVFCSLTSSGRPFSSPTQIF